MSCDVGKATEGWRMSCDVGEVTESLENERSSYYDVPEAGACLSSPAHYQREGIEIIETD